MTTKKLYSLIITTLILCFAFPACTKKATSLSEIKPIPNRINPIPKDTSEVMRWTLTSIQHTFVYSMYGQTPLNYLTSSALVFDIIMPTNFIFRADSSLVTSNITKDNSIIKCRYSIIGSDLFLSDIVYHYPTYSDSDTLHYIINTDQNSVTVISPLYGIWRGDCSNDFDMYRVTGTYLVSKRKG